MMRQAEEEPLGNGHEASPSDAKDVLLGRSMRFLCLAGLFAGC